MFSTQAKLLSGPVKSATICSQCWYKLSQRSMKCKTSLRLLHSTPRSFKQSHSPELSLPPTFFSANESYLSLQSLNEELAKSHKTSPRLSQPPNQPNDITAYPPSDLQISTYKPALPLSLSSTLKVYSQLSKTRLTVLIVLTAMSGVALSPIPASVPVLLSTALGTFLCSASANTFNQLVEVPYDAQMARTRNRPLVRRAITPFHAAVFGAVSGVSGVGILWSCVGTTCAVLGLGNIALYAGAYTWLKRKSVANTWVGAVVGAIPPLMGWSACGNALLPVEGFQAAPMFLPSFLSGAVGAIDPLILSTSMLPPIMLAIYHFSWQFPHFNSLSHFVRPAYAQSGYSMLCITDPAKNGLVAVRYAVLMTVVCAVGVPLSGLTSWWFALTSLVPNGILLQSSWKFWQCMKAENAAQGAVIKGSGEKAARRLFAHSLWYLPVILGLMMFHKTGMEWSKWLGFGSNVKDEDTTL